MKQGPKILLLDIETAPSIATIWSLWTKQVGLHNVLQDGYVLSWAAKWLGERTTYFFAGDTPEHRDQMIQAIWAMLDEADVVVHYNGRSFDVPTLNGEFAERDMWPPSPYKQIDLLKVVQKSFRFLSNKLAYVAPKLGLSGKVKVDHQLWLDCMAGKPEAWKRMEKYNKNDVTELERAYIKLRPWFDGAVNLGMWIDSAKPVCPVCGSTHLQSRGKQINKTLSYERFQCMKCGAWSRARFAEKQTPEFKQRQRVKIGE